MVVEAQTPQIDRELEAVIRGEYKESPKRREVSKFSEFSLKKKQGGRTSKRKRAKTPKKKKKIAKKKKRIAIKKEKFGTKREKISRILSKGPFLDEKFEPCSIDQSFSEMGFSLENQLHDGNYHSFFDQSVNQEQKEDYTQCPSTPQEDQDSFTKFPETSTICIGSGSVGIFRMDFSSMGERTHLRKRSFDFPGPLPQDIETAESASWRRKNTDPEITLE